MHEAVALRLRELASHILEHSNQKGSKRDVLRRMLKEGARFSMSHAALMETTVRQELTGGELGAAKLLEPLIADILRVESLEERRHARLLCFQIFC